jgi:O-antigen/teichoic acid export membrane protein
MTTEAAGSGLWRLGTAVFHRLRSQAARRLSWGIADQVVSSLTNFAAGIYVVRTLGAAQFGAFSLAYVTYGFALNASRGLATDPLMVRFSGTDLPTWRRAAAKCTGTAVVVGLATGALVLGAAAVLTGTAAASFLALGLTLPGLMLQDAWRYSFFALGRGGHAFLNDTVWAAILLPALVLLRATGHADVFWFTFAWGATGAAAAAIGPLQARVLPNPAGAWEWISSHRDLGIPYLLEGTSSNAVNQVRGYGVALILGLAAVGYVQASVTLMGPMTILFLGMGLVTIPEAARVLQRSPRHLPLFCLLVSAGLAVAGLAWGIVLLVAVPRGLGNGVLGPVWRPAYPLVVPQMLFVVAQGVGSGAGVGLHALGAARRSLRLVVVMVTLTSGFTLAGAWMAGVVGTVIGMAIGAWLGSLLSWWQFSEALRESNTAPATAWLQPNRQAGKHRIVR